MTSLLPTRIEQVYDNSGEAGRKLLDIMGQQAKDNPYDDIAYVLDKYHKGKDAESIADSTAIINKALEEGLTGAQALEKAKQAGYDSRILGSDPVQEALRKSRASIIAQRVEDRAAQTYNSTLLADKSIAELEDTVRQLGAAGLGMTGLYTDQIREKLKNDPVAYKKYMDYIASKGYALTPLGDAKGVSLDVHPQDDLDTQIQRLRYLKDTLAASGIQIATSPEEELKLSDPEAMIADLAKKFGREGDAFAGFRDNLMDDFVHYKGKYKELPNEVILHAMRMNIDTEWLSNWGDYEQTYRDKVENYLDKYGQDYYGKKQSYLAAEKHLKTLEDFRNKGGYTALQSALATVGDNLINNIKQKRLSEDVANKLLAYYAKKTNTDNANVTEAYNLASELLKQNGITAS